MKTASSLIEGGRAIVWSVEGPADRGAGPLLGAGGGSSSTAAAGWWLGGGGRRLGGLGSVEAPQLKYLARRRMYSLTDKRRRHS